MLLRALITTKVSSPDEVVDTISKAKDEGRSKIVVLLQRKITAADSLPSTCRQTNRSPMTAARQLRDKSVPGGRVMLNRVKFTELQDDKKKHD